MRRVSAFSIGLFVTSALLLQGALSAAAFSAVPAAWGHDGQYQDQNQSDEGYQPYSAEELDNIMSPIALYPDPLLSQVLVAATFVDQVTDAANYVRSYGTNGVDDQNWDVSVRAVAHYPTVIEMMADRIDWTTSVGQAYVSQSTDVMSSVQRLRHMARNVGNLISTPQQEVIATGDYILIDPIQPQFIFVPVYDPAICYFRRPSSGFAISFGAGFAIGAWLNLDLDWGHRRVFYTGWEGGGWIERSRPHIQITNVYVNNSYRNVIVNRTVINRTVNVTNINRYNYVHKDVQYKNVQVNNSRPAVRNARLNENNRPNNNARPNGRNNNERPNNNARPENRVNPNDRANPNSRPNQPAANRPANRENNNRPENANRPAARPNERPNARPESPRPNERPAPRENRPSNTRPESRPNTQPRPNARPPAENRPSSRPAERPESRPATRPQPRPESRPQPKPEARPESRPQPRPESRPSQPRPESRPQPRPESRPQPRPESHPSQPAARPKPAPRSEAKPKQQEKPPKEEKKPS